MDPQVRFESPDPIRYLETVEPPAPPSATSVPLSAASASWMAGPSPDAGRSEDNRPPEIGVDPGGRRALYFGVLWFAIPLLLVILVEVVFFRG
jgi:hypothetical protein